MAVIHKMTNLAPNLAVFGIRNRTATMVSNTPDPSRNTGSGISPCTAYDTDISRQFLSPFRLAMNSSLKVFEVEISQIHITERQYMHCQNVFPFTEMDF